MRKINTFLLCLICFGLIGVESTAAVASASMLESTKLPEIVDFKVTPTDIDSGSMSTLSWEVRDFLTAYIDHGIGSVSAAGKITVNPQYSTTYKLTVSNNTGVRTRYVTLYVELPRAYTSDVVNSDPVTGRNAEVDMAWEQLCLSRQYQVQIARDANFTLIMYDSGAMETADALLPAFWYPPGNLEAGHTYYWRVRARQAATGQYILSFWSEPRPFTVKPGYSTRNGYNTVQAFTPINGCTACPVKPVSFSWSGYQDTTRYRFLLARDSQLQDVVVEAFTSTTAYALSEALEYDTSYFWQVMAVEPVPSDPSSLFTFHTEAAPEPVNNQTSSVPSDVPLWGVVVMIAGGLLIVVVILLLVAARKSI